MKRYYFRRDDKELARLKRDLYYYAKVMNLEFVNADAKDGWICEIRREDAEKAVVFVIRDSLNQAVTCQMGIIDWIEPEKLASSFFPELLSEVKETSVNFMSGSREKEIRHDVKVLAKVRLGSYFDSRKDVSEE